MSRFFAFLLFEKRHFLTPRNVIVLLLVVFISMYVIQSGSNKYNKTMADKDQFLKVEKTKVSQYMDYTQYGGYGFRLLMLPSTLSTLFFNSGLFSELTGAVNSADTLKLYQSLIGYSLFAAQKGKYEDYSGIVLIFCSFFALYAGWDSLRNKKFLKFLSAKNCHRKEFFYIQIIRLFLLNLFFLLLSCLALFMLFLNNIELSSSQYHVLFHFQLTVFLTILFFFYLGTLLGSIKKRQTGFTALVVLWGLLIYVVPTIAEELVVKEAEKITGEFPYEMKKLKIIMAFETGSLSEALRYGSMSQARDSEKILAEGYYVGELRKLQQVEEAMQEKMEQIQKYSTWLSSLFPTTHYLSATKSLSSHGYKNFFAFYRYIRILKHAFLRFYINKRYLFNHSSVQPFTQNTENVFIADSVLPDTYRQGSFFTLIQILTLATLSYYIYFREPRSPDVIEAPPVIVEPGDTSFLYCENVPIKQTYFRQFQRIPGIVCIDHFSSDDFELGVTPSALIDFFSIMRNCDPGKVREYISTLEIDLHDRLSSEQLHEEVYPAIYIAMQLAVEAKILIFEDILKGRSPKLEKWFTGLLNKLGKEGKAFVYMSTQLYSSLNPIEEVIKIDKHNWLKVDFNRIILR